MGQQSMSRQFANTVNQAARWLVGAMMVLTATFLVSSAQAKNKPEEFTAIYTHTYDEVFQAAQEAIERLGMFVTDKDKDKGMITGHGQYKPTGATRSTEVNFELHIEPVSPKPEVRITVDAKAPRMFGFVAKRFATDLQIETQKVLATYK